MSMNGTVLKDSYYKERLLQSNSFNHAHPNTNSFEESQDEQPVITPQQQQLNLQKILFNFAKTAEGSNYGFLQFVCTHKRLTSLHKIKQFRYLQKVDLSYNNLKSLSLLSGLPYLVQIKATNNHITGILEIKQPPLHLHTVDLSYNHITKIPNLKAYRHLTVLKLKSNKIKVIQGISNQNRLSILNLSQNNIEEITGLKQLNLTQLQLSSNQITVIKGLHQLPKLRVLDLSINRIIKLAGLVNLISLRTLVLAKNSIKHIKQMDYLENMAYLSVLDLCYNPIQQRKYYRWQCLYKLPMLQTLDGVQVGVDQILQAETFYGLDVEQKANIFKQILPEETFIDRRIHRSELIDNQTDSAGQGTKFVDQYEENGQIKSYDSKSKNGSKGFSASKRSAFSKQSKKSYHSKP